MKLLKRTLIFGLLLAAALSAEAGDVFVVPLKGEVSEAQFFFLRRAIKQAERDDASAIILDMDTYGGSLQSAVNMLNALSTTALPTYTYVNNNAGSAGALIAISTRHIYMAPVSAIGAAAPVMAGGQELPPTMSDKIISYFSGYFRSAAEKNGYNPDIAEAFINKDKEVKIGDRVIHAKGSLLTLSAQEAVKKENGKPLLASGIASSLGDIMTQAKLSGALRRFEPTGFEQVAFWITKLAPLFLLGGIIGAYIEFKTPGFGLPGIVSIICFLIFFTGHYIAGLAGWEVFVIFFVGVALVVSELVLHPGTILPGLAGLVLMLGALLYAMIDRYPSQPLLPTPEMLITPMFNLAIAGAAGVIAILILAKYLPQSPLYDRIVLGSKDPPGPSLSDVSIESPLRIQPGALGFAKTILRPSGKAAFGDLLLDVVTQGDFIQAGANVRVLKIEGARIVVEAAV